MTKYLVVIEKAGKNFSAYCPDIPGCIATGATKKQAERRIRSAITFHLEGLEREGLERPLHSATAEYITL